MPIAAIAVVTSCVWPAGAAERFVTRDPLRAFVYERYARGDDYFINGTAGALLLRCALTPANAPYAGVALSESSIWGNRGGPWELFRRRSDGRFAYMGSRRLADLSCLQSCSAGEFLATGRCAWRAGWP